jgi:alkaline phosphatase
MRPLVLTLYFLLAGSSFAQQYTSSAIFSHNDYEGGRPFFEAYELEAGFIEADVFFENGVLLVAHTREEQNVERTLESLYLKPLQHKIKINNGFVYSDHSKTLTLMIDLKSEGISTLNAIVDQLKKYPEIVPCKTLSVSISGNVPDRSQWKSFPGYIYFDGRPGIEYSQEELKRVSFISTSFKTVSEWNGTGIISEADKHKVISLRDEVHTKNKKLRFWGAPDNATAWSTWIDLKIDILGTDKVAELADFLLYRAANRNRQR